VSTHVAEKRQPPVVRCAKIATRLPPRPSVPITTSGRHKANFEAAFDPIDGAGRDLACMEAVSDFFAALRAALARIAVRTGEGGVDAAARATDAVADLLQRRAGLSDRQARTAAVAVLVAVATSGAFAAVSGGVWIAPPPLPQTPLPTVARSTGVAARCWRVAAAASLQRTMCARLAVSQR